MNSTERAPRRDRRTRPGALARALPLLLLLLSGCILFARGKRGDTPEDVALHVTNHNWSTVVLFAVHGGMRVRLGDVTTGSEADMIIPRDLAITGAISLQVHAIGSGRDYATGPIQVRPGQEIELRVENSLVQTSWSVY